MSDPTHKRLGFDIGGTKVAAIVLQDDSTEPLLHLKESTPPNYDDLLKLLKSIFDKVTSEFGEVTVGVCHPGSTIPRNGQIHNSNLRYFNGHTFRSDIQALLHCPVQTANDANCFALSEAMAGVAKDVGVVFGATLGSGLGGGLVFNKTIQHGLNGVGAEWGHISLPWQNDSEFALKLPCYCGLENCQESFLSGKGLAQDYERAVGKALKGEDIVTLAENGDHEANICLERYEHRLARACAMVINIIDPDMIVLGGGLSSLQRLYVNVPKLWDPYIFSNEPVSTPLKQAKFGGDSGCRGAAYLGSMKNEK